MKHKEEYIVTAELKNGKHVQLDMPDYTKMSIGYKYVSIPEMNLSNIIKPYGEIQLNSPIYKTIEDGNMIMYTIIDFTPIVLARIKL